MTDRYYGTTVNGSREGVGMLVDGQSEYVGKFKAGLKHGYGKRVGPQGMREGNWEIDQVNGVGLEIKKSGQAILGEWRDGEIHGVAQVTDDDFNELCSYKNGEKEGKCIIVYKNEEMARGNFKKSLKSGWWKEYTSEGIFTGLYLKNEKCGYGSLVSNRSKFRGNWASNSKNGFGIYIMDTLKYEGELKNGKFEGIGRLSDKTAEGSYKYVGHYENHLRAGMGRLDDYEGSYIGGFDNDYRKGLGYIKMAHDTSYLGYWINDLKDGLGILKTGKKVVKAQWSQDKIDGLCYTIVPGQRNQFEVYENGHYVEDADPAEMDDFLQAIEEKIPDRFIDFANAKIAKVEADINRAVKKINEIEEPEFDFRDLQLKFETIKTMMTNGTTKGKHDRESLMNLLQKHNVNVKKSPGFEWEIPKKTLANKKNPDSVFGPGFDETATPRKVAPQPEQPVYSAQRSSPNKSQYDSEVKRRVKKSSALKDEQASVDLSSRTFEEDRMRSVDHRPIHNNKARVKPNSQDDDARHMPSPPPKTNKARADDTKAAGGAIGDGDRRRDGQSDRKADGGQGQSDVRNCPAIGKALESEKPVEHKDEPKKAEPKESLEEITKKIEEQRIASVIKKVKLETIPGKVVLPTLKPVKLPDLIPEYKEQKTIAPVEKEKQELSIISLKGLELKGAPKAEVKPVPEAILKEEPQAVTTEPEKNTHEIIDPNPEVKNTEQQEDPQPANDQSIGKLKEQEIPQVKCLNISRPVSFEPYHKLKKLSIFKQIAEQVSKY